jgi:hypothetical protein
MAGFLATRGLRSGGVRHRLTADRKEHGVARDGGDSDGDVHAHESSDAAPGGVQSVGDADQQVRDEAEQQHSRDEPVQEPSGAGRPGPHQLPAESAGQDAHHDENGEGSRLQGAERVSDTGGMSDRGDDVARQAPDDYGREDRGGKGGGTRQPPDSGSHGDRSGHLGLLGYGRCLTGG